MVKTVLMGLVGIERGGMVAEPPAGSDARDSMATLLAGLACMGGLIHLGAAVDHADELLLYSFVFVMLACAQFVWAAMVLRHASDRVLLCGCVLNAGVIALWLLSRTTGMPIAPRPWVAEPVGFADLVETAGEMVVLLTAWSLLAAPRSRIARLVSSQAAVPIVTMLVVSALFGVSAHAG